MSELITVTGGTGTLGRRVVADLLAGGHPVRILTRNPPRKPSAAEHRPADLRSGVGIDAALDGTHTIVHCATAPRGDLTAASHLIPAAERAGVAHLVYISIVGVDKIHYFYYNAKHAVERAIEAGGVPWTIMRATQFHNLVLGGFLAQRRLPVLLCPDLRVQPVEVRDVAARLVMLATGEPAGRVDDMGGPQVRTVRDLASAYLTATGRRRPLVPVRIPGRAFRAYRAGANLAPDHATGVGTFEDFLARVVG